MSHSILIRQIKRIFGISASRMAVRPFMPWYIRWAIALPFLLVAGGLVWWAFVYGLEFAGFYRGKTQHELGVLQEQVTILKKENQELANLAAFFERQAQISQAANLETESQLKSINDENFQLQEDLRLFQSLTLSGAREGDVSIQHLKVERDTLPGEYRYRLLIVQGGQLRSKVFQGNLQLLVHVRLNGERSVVVLPSQNGSGENPANLTTDAQSELAAYQLNFKYYQRIERTFRLPADMKVERIQVRIFEQGSSEPKVKRSVTLS